MIRFSAPLFLAASTCQSTEETRYYLNGVYVEPAKNGVTLTATDGHRLIHISDESGHCDEPAIVRILGDVLKTCKPKKDRRYVVVDGTVATVFIADLNSDPADTEGDRPHALAHDCIIDGMYPTYRRIIPAKVPGPSQALFNPHYLGSFAKIGADLASYVYGKGSSNYGMMLSGGEGLTPALVTWPLIPLAFGVLMPMRPPGPMAIPSWYEYSDRVEGLPEPAMEDAL